jgi:hypothetical protein
MPIKYSDGYKYQLREDYSVLIPHAPESTVSTEYLTLTDLGMLTVRKGYAWDGPSGPTFDSKSSLRASLVHDALYQFIRLGLLPEDPWRLWADELLRELCITDGMNHLRADLWYHMVRDFAGAAAHPSAERPILEAP